MDHIRKHSRKRDAILCCLRSTSCHPSAEWVFRQLKPDIPDLSLGTVYRNLTLFKDEGLIRSLGTVKGLERFDGNIEEHSHFICSCCGMIIDLPDTDLSTSVPDCLNRSGYSVQRAELRITGLCPECRNK